MGWFEKKDERERKIPPLPELPELPELPDFEYSNQGLGIESRKINQLPTLPNNSFGNKFSQNAIKEAVSGEEEDEEVFDADEFEDERTMREPLEKMPVIRRKSLTREINDEEIPKEFEEAAMRVRRAEPIFVRIDKFENAIHSFEKTRAKILEIEKTLRSIKKIKEDEEKELEAWENEIQLIKQEIEKINKDIFSKIE